MFTGFNLLQWRQYVQITLKGRLMNHLLEDGPSRTDPKYYDWLDVEGVVHRWLLDSISPSVKGEFMSLESARAVWEAVLESHSKKHNIATLYELVHRAANLSQGDRSIMEYSTELISLWNEIDYYMPPDPHSVDRQYILQLRVFQFLMGLNPEYEVVRAQLIHRETGPTFKDALHSVRVEESRFQQAQNSASALVAHSSSSARPSSTPPPGSLPRGPTARTEDSPKGDPSLFCNYCKKRGHSKETCYKLQRKRAQPSNLAAAASSVPPPRVKCLCCTVFSRLVPRPLASLRKRWSVYAACLILQSWAHAPWPTQVSGRTISIAEEHEGLYLVRPCSSSLAFAAAAVSLSASHERLWLLHRRLGHPSFATLYRLFPKLFQGHSVDRFVCTACRIAKHHRTTYPISSSHSLTPFSLIHTDVWGPSPIHSTSGSRWSPFLLNNATRFTWPESNNISQYHAVMPYLETVAV
ncbi:uncharacterized protein LOC144702933 [Wolffia australiana]